MLGTKIATENYDGYYKGGSTLKTHTILLSILVLGLTHFSQEIQEEAIAINIEVPTRVFKGNTFIDNLTIDDFEIYEDGVLQKTEAVYLINKQDIVREETELKKEEARKIFAPKVSRNFVFLFEIHEYLPTIGKAIEYFFNDVYVMGDALTVMTPLHTYSFISEALEILSKKKITRELIEQLRLDTWRSTQTYRSLLRDLEYIKRFEKDTESGFEDLIRKMHSNITSKLRDLRYLDENKLLEFMDFLLSTEGPKHVFFFLQKLQIPIIRYNPVFDFDDLEEFDAYMAVDEIKIKQIFSDSSITAHMIYVTKLSDLDIIQRETGSLTTLTTIPGALQDISGSIFSSFKDIAETTGGIVDSSTSVAFSFKKAAAASENYYLLYYSPKNYIADGKFKEIKIQVKGQRYKISHRAGYVAD